MDFKAKRAIQKLIAENLAKLESGELGFKEKRGLQKSITADIQKLEGKAPVETDIDVAMLLDRLDSIVIGNEEGRPDYIAGEIAQVEDELEAKRVLGKYQAEVDAAKGVLAKELEKFKPAVPSGKTVDDKVFMRKLTSHINDEFPSSGGIMNRGGKDDFQSMIPVNQRFGLPESFLEKVKPVAKDFVMEKGKVSMPVDAWRKVFPETEIGIDTKQKPLDLLHPTSIDETTESGLEQVISWHKKRIDETPGVAVSASKYTSGFHERMADAYEQVLGFLLESKRDYQEASIAAGHASSDFKKAEENAKEAGDNMAFKFANAQKLKYAELEKRYWDKFQTEDPPTDTQVEDPIVSPTFDKLKNGDFIDLPANEFEEKLIEAAKELGVEDSLTMDIIGPAIEWKERREGVANEGVDPDLEGNDGTPHEELDDIALEDVKTKLNIGDKFKLSGKVSHISSEESDKKTRGNYHSIDIEFPFNNDWVRQNSRFSTHFRLKDDEKNPFKIGDEVTLNAEIKEIKGRKPKDGDTPLVYYGVSFKSPEGFTDPQEDYVNFAPEKSVLKHMIGEVPATESTDQDFELDQETEDLLVEEIKSDYEISPELEQEGIATEKVEHIKKLWDYAKKIVLRARFDKAPSGDKKKDEEILTEGKAWGFVQDRYQKLKSGKIKARKPATESVDEETEGEEIIL